EGFCGGMHRPPTPLPRSTGGEGFVFPLAPCTQGERGRGRGVFAVECTAPSPLPLSPGVPGERGSCFPSPLVLKGRGVGERGLSVECTAPSPLPLSPGGTGGEGFG